MRAVAALLLASLDILFHGRVIVTVTPDLDDTSINISPERRRFRILDGILLTAAVGFALYLCQCVTRVELPPTGMRLVLSICTFGWVLTWTIALLTAADSIPIRMASRSPGKLAVLLIAAMTLLKLVLGWYWLFVQPASLSDRMLSLFWMAVAEPKFPVFAVVSGWLTLWLTQATNTQNDWLDVSGRILGVFWIATALASPVLLNAHVLEIFGVTLP